MALLTSIKQAGKKPIQFISNNYIKKILYTHQFIRVGGIHSTTEPQVLIYILRFSFFL